jgi:uncharacterized protein
MPADANLATIKAIYQAFGSGDVATILDSCTDDVDWAADAASTDAPRWGNRTGEEAVSGSFTGIAGAIEVTEFTPLSLAANDTEVMVLLQFGSRNIATGKQATMHLHHYWRVRDGKVEYYRGSEDTQLTASTFAT